MDWTGCSYVEIVPGKVSGAPILVHSRMPADAVLGNFDAGLSPKEIAEDYDQDIESVLGVLEFAGRLRQTAA